MTLGGAAVCVPIGISIAIFGRKMVMLVMVIPYLLGWACIIWAANVFMLYVGRFVVGASGASFCVTVPMYTTEIAEIQIRGVIGCFYQLWIVHGILYSYGVGAAFPPIIVNTLCGILPILFFAFFFWMPESPVYLAQKGRDEQAEKSMRWLRGDDADISADMKAILEDANKEKQKLMEGMSRMGSMWGLCISITLMFFQQFTGINAIIFYSTSIFTKAGTGISPEWCTVILGIVQVFATIMAIMMVDKSGRRVLLLISAILMCLTTLMMGLDFHYLKDANVGWLPVFSTCLFMVGFSMGFGPVPWLVIGEMFAEDMKPLLGSIVGVCNWLFAFCITKCFPICLDIFGGAATFWLFAIISFLACVFIILLVPETKGKTLNEIQELFGG
ncbi:facilitated trehalose transporter Tret1-like [Drosophila innubila]|uniref:facilitated trehalose transporter Tret1-like n=1 Tax=Drosophila innubila TaxID=198719 RepID=UPI00148E8BEE|nr:facilitated trehalose transporter Tret1-like [Drosophila innubila]